MVNDTLFFILSIQAFNKITTEEERQKFIRNVLGNIHKNTEALWESHTSFDIAEAKDLEANAGFWTGVRDGMRIINYGQKCEICEYFKKPCYCPI